MVEHARVRVAFLAIWCHTLLVLALGSSHAVTTRLVLCRVHSFLDLIIFFASQLLICNLLECVGPLSRQFSGSLTCTLEELLVSLYNRSLFEGLAKVYSADQLLCILALIARELPSPRLKDPLLGIGVKRCV